MESSGIISLTAVPCCGLYLDQKENHKIINDHFEFTSKPTSPSASPDKKKVKLNTLLLIANLNDINIAGPKNCRSLLYTQPEHFMV